jgi:hypothetical protein
MTVTPFYPPAVKGQKADTLGQSLFPWLGTKRAAPDEAPAQAHSSTSKAAARSVTCTSGRARVFAFLKQRGQHGSTDEEVAAELGRPGRPTDCSTLRARRVELVAAGDVRDSGRRRPTVSGADAVVWVVVGPSTLPEASP